MKFTAKDLESAKESGIIDLKTQKDLMAFFESRKKDSFNIFSIILYTFAIFFGMYVVFLTSQLDGKAHIIVGFTLSLAALIIQKKSKKKLVSNLSGIFGVLSLTWFTNYSLTYYLETFDVANKELISTLLHISVFLFATIISNTQTLLYDDERYNMMTALYIICGFNAGMTYFFEFRYDDYLSLNLIPAISLIALSFIATIKKKMQKEDFYWFNTFTFPLLYVTLGDTFAGYDFIEDFFGLFIGILFIVMGILMNYRYVSIIGFIGILMFFVFNLFEHLSNNIAAFILFALALLLIPASYKARKYEQILQNKIKVASISRTFH